MPVFPPLRRFKSDSDGSVVTFWAVSLAVFMGLLALIFDFGRMATTQSELQSFADNVVLAAAAELDGRSDAMTRATNAASLITDQQTYGDGGSELSGPSDYSMTFYSVPPVDGVGGTETTVASEARYVRAVIDQRNVTPGFGAAFAALTGNAVHSGDVEASALAGGGAYACDMTPLMFCLPNPDFAAEDNIGDAILLRTGGNGAGWGPGAFGFIDPSTGNIDENGVCAGLTGSSLTGCLIAAVGNTTACFDQFGVTVKPGQNVGTFEASLNVLFDIYHATMNNKKNDPLYPPAPNVISGYIPKNGSCIKNNSEVSPDTVGLPPDDCFGTGGCNRFGDGDWSTGRQAYVDTNYGGVDPHPSAVTRYEYYKAEIAAAGGGASNADILIGLAENGRPQCSNNQSPNPERRVMVAAGIDCTANPVSGGSTVPVQEFFEIFLMSPIGLDGTKDIWVEVVGSAHGLGDGNETDAIIHDGISLLR